MRLDRAFAASLAASLLLPAGGFSAPQHKQQPVFGADVSLVVLPVFVSDRAGRAVRGLQAEDFEVQDDGKPVDVVLFRYVDTTEDERREELSLASAARRRFLLLFDKSFTDPAGLHRAQRAAADFVRRRLAASDLAAVATFDVRNGIRLVANFTEDRALLVHAVQTLGVPQLATISDPLGLAADFGVTDIAPGPGDSEQEIPQALLDNVLAVLVRQMQTAEREQYEDQIVSLIGGFQDLARGLRNVDGRKQILYFSAGFDSRLLVGEEGSDRRSTALSITQGRLWEVDGQARYGDSRLRGLLDQAMRGLAAADAVVHSVDVMGLGGKLALDQIAAPSDAGRLINSGRESLNLLAADTGGRFFKDTNDLAGALAEMLEMTSRYYVLGVQPREVKGPGQYHKLRVKLARKGAKLSHRPGYHEKTPATQQTVLQRQFEAAELVMAAGPLNSLKFSSLCLPFPGPGTEQALGLVLQIPKESLTWASGKSVSIDAYGYAVAEDGGVRDHMAKYARLDLAELDPEGRANGISLFGTLAVPPGKYTIRLLVRDVESGRSGVQLLDITVPPYDPRVGFLLPPVVVDEVDRWLNLEVGRSGGKRPKLGFPFEIAGRPFLPRASFELRPGQAERLVVFAYEPARPGDPAAGLDISTTLADRSGKPVRPGLLHIEKVHRQDSGRRTFVFGYTPEPVSPGDYTLRIRVGEGGLLLESYALVRLRSGS